MTLTSTAAASIGELLSDPRHPGWGQPPWPEKIKHFEPHQKIAIARIVAALDSGKRLVLVAGPVGTGKTVIYEAVRRIYRPGHCTYACIDHALQDQVAYDFDYAINLKGRDNYATQDFPEHFDLPRTDPRRVTCADCDYSEGICSYCSDPNWCEYRMTRDTAVVAPLSVSNMYYLLNEWNHLGAGSQFTNRPLVIFDEADTAERMLWNFEEIAVSPSMQRYLGIEPPDKKTVAEAWERWFFGEAIPACERALDGLRRIPATDVQRIRRRTTIKRLLGRLREVAPQVAQGRWVYDYAESDGETFIRFKPIRADEIAHKLMWDHAQRWVCGSATMLSANVFCDPLGWYDPVAYIEIPSTFPPERRPIRVVPIADMKRANREEAWPKLAHALRGMLADHPTERVLLHTVSYALARYLMDNVGSPRLMSYERARERTRVLADFRTRPGAVLVAPSMDRGIDLPYDACDVAVVTQLSFPNLGDKQVKERRFSKGGKQWYAAEAIKSLHQAVGRHHRSADDTSVTYITDSRFSRVHRQHSELFMSWFNEALVSTGDWAKRWLAA